VSRAANISDLDFDGLISGEWLVTNGLGGFAGSTLCGLNTRRYHGLLIAAMSPPVRRMVLLSRVEETVRCDGREFYLSCNEYPGTIWPNGHELLRAFSASPHPRWAYQGDGWTLQKELRLLRGQNTVLLSYTLLGGGNGVDLEVRPLLALRGMHELCYQWNGKLDAKPQSQGHWHVPATRRTPEIFFAHDGRFDRRSHWYLNQIYRREGEYGYAGLEDLWSPGACQFRLSPGQTMHFACSADPIELSQVVAQADRQVRGADLQTAAGPELDDDLEALLRANEDHLVMDRDGAVLPTAGQYHWSPPSVRKALVGFAGLLLVPGRIAEAGSILATLAGSLQSGLLPTDYPVGDDPVGREPAHPGADVSLWYVHAIRQYLLYGGDADLVQQQLLPAVLSILDAYRRGAARNIHTDVDGLLHCGAPDHALTWMDNRVGGVPVTPRHGRAVEINALWYNALMSAADLCRRFDRPADAEGFESSAARAKYAFNQSFWNSAAGCCYDVVGDGGVDDSIRPNQLLAISLPFAVLQQDRWATTLATVREHLLTPYGVRTLSPKDGPYLGRYHGPLADRDRAAHNGSAYPWLLGPLVTAMVRAASADAQPAVRKQARAMLAPCLAYLSKPAGHHLFELCDGQAPHAPGGAIASPLSVAELLRCYAEDVLGRRPASPQTPPPSTHIEPVASTPAV